MALELVANNSDDDIERHKMDTVPARWNCRRCGHRWQETLEQIMERNGACPNCGK